MRNKLGSAINRRVSGVRLTAEDERALLAGVMERKDEIVKKKISVAMVAAAVLIFAAVTCAFAASMNATPTPTPLAPADDALLITPEPTPVPAFSESEWNDSASDGVVNMKMQYVSVEGAYVTMKVRLTPVRSERVYLALNDSESGVDSCPGRWNLVISRDDLHLILPQALDSGRRSTQVAVDEYGLTFTLCGWLRDGRRPRRRGHRRRLPAAEHQREVRAERRKDYGNLQRRVRRGCRDRQPRRVRHGRRLRLRHHRLRHRPRAGLHDRTRKLHAPRPELRRHAKRCPL